MKIGVLALQGAFIEHIEILRKLGFDAIPVRTIEELNQVDGLIIPGGESTAMGILAQRKNFLEALKNFTSQKPTWGTCAGMIVLSNKVMHQKQGGQTLIGGLDVTVDRNHFGSQISSFETNLEVPQIGKEPFPAIFIRAPVIVEKGPNVEVLAQMSDNEIVAVKQGNILATSFHPELSSDSRWHQYFAELVKTASSVDNNNKS